MCRQTTAFKRIVIALIIILNCLASGTASADTRFRDLANWQGDLDPDTPITEVNTPGTHDSAMFGIGSGIFEGFGFAHNQDLTFAEQLNIGVRYIDGRFCYVKKGKADETENIFCCHDEYIPEMNGRDISLKDMLAELNKFLDDHPTEYIFLPYKCEDEEDMEEGKLNALLNSIFNTLASKNKERYMAVRAGDRVPTVEEAQGHIIVTPNSNSGIFCDYCCIANTYDEGTDEKVKELSEVFNIENIRRLSKDPRLFSRNYDDRPKSERCPRLIHTSCYQAPIRTPARTSGDIYKWILGRVDELDGVAPPEFHAGYYYGIVLFDYVKEEECRLIVDLNKTETEGAAAQPEKDSVPANATMLGDSETVIAIAVFSVVLIACITSILVFSAKKKHRQRT